MIQFQDIRFLCGTNYRVGLQFQILMTIKLHHLTRQLKKELEDPVNVSFILLLRLLVVVSRHWQSRVWPTTTMRSPEKQSNFKLSFITMNIEILKIV